MKLQCYKYTADGLYFFQFLMSVLEICYFKRLKSKIYKYVFKDVSALVRVKICKSGMQLKKMLKMYFSTSQTDTGYKYRTILNINSID